jgi:hypothetical protein
MGKASESSIRAKIDQLENQVMASGYLDDEFYEKIWESFVEMQMLQGKTEEQALADVIAEDGAKEEFIERMRERARSRLEMAGIE